MNDYLATHYVSDKSGVYCRPNTGKFSYSDGDAVEDDLLAFILSTEDRSVLSDALRRGMVDWPTTYHLSSQRANLLRPFEHLLTGQLLELGCGCGAVTRYLGELGSEVTAVEGSLRRAHIARARTADLPNVKIVCDEIGAFGPSKTFNSVILVGVLEYSTRFGGKDGAANLLRHAAGLLKPAGRLFLAIENQLGLKYLAGAPEDHIGRPFVGVDDGYALDGTRTWGRRTLEKMLIAAGLPEVRTFIACPDYKLVQTIVDPELAERWPDVAAALVQTAWADPQQPETVTFSLEQGWKLACMNGIAADLANSFLILASNKPYPPSDFLAWHYSTSRRRSYTKVTRFRVAEDGLQVDREALTDDAGEPSPLQWVLRSESAYEGVNWWGALVDVLNRPGWTLDDLIGWFRPWLEEVASGPPILASWPEQQLAGDRLDHVSHNAVRTASGAFSFFDDEWGLSKPITLGLLAFRCLHEGFHRVTSCAAPADGTPIAYCDLIPMIFSRFGAELSAKQLDDYLTFEDQLHSWVSGVEVPLGSATVEYAWRKLSVRGPDASAILTSSNVKNIDNNIEHRPNILSISSSPEDNINKILNEYKSQIEELRARSYVPIVGYGKLLSVSAPMYLDGWMGEELSFSVEPLRPVYGLRLVVWSADDVAHDFEIAVGIGDHWSTTIVRNGLFTIPLWLADPVISPFYVSVKSAWTRRGSEIDERLISVIVNTIELVH